jgi:hypothetical protein
MALQFEEDKIVQGFQACYARFMQPGNIDPRHAPSAGACLAKYECWFHNEDRPYMLLSTAEQYIKCLMRLRLGSLPLRCSDHTKPREERVCTLCRCNSIEDEKHIMFECPRYKRIRQHRLWSPLFEGGHTDMTSLMGHQDQFKLSHFVYTVMKRRSELMPQTMDMFDSSDEE